ncbi:hypothetical protein AALP_AAs72314U000400 [Arabis alpina]|uniref:Senescence-associated carboxylesterase 101 n=1 Tax=Arabis alpina TaxID=50452 RepID=A0A087G1H1_ARAAL|nr:hypothetical protein AALP_AAs72314U000400 [Arabis alpina]
MDSSFSLDGIELGKLVLNSGLLDISWKKISETYNQNQDPAPRFKIYEEAITFVVFLAPPPTSINESCNSAFLLESEENPNPFHFLCPEETSSFSCQLFASAYNEKLLDLKSELLMLLESKKPVIITGAALGGYVASLFTLWLLETMDPKLKRPLCITFGSPLIGEASLPQILENSVRSSCFLHVADTTKNPITAGFMPIGTFLICFESESVCIEDPEAVMELLVGCTNTDLVDYGEVLHRLDQSVLSMADSRLVPDNVIKGMKKRAEKKKERYDPAKKLNDVKVSMAYIEKYKSKTKELKTGNYYDQYRSEIRIPADSRVDGWKKELNLYWKSLVEDVEKKPQREVANLSRRFLFSGNNYRRLFEPLDIAEYYREGGTEYSVRGRSHHYVMLEKWFKDAKPEPVKSASSDLRDLLTFDSCFWAEVEEAMIIINQLKAVEGMGDEVLMGKLVKFEEYVWGMIEKREVSPEIFLEQSSFMRWWKEYKEIKVDSSHFTEFMNNETYKSYGKNGA